MPLSALILDDEEMARYFLNSSIVEHCPEISETREANSVAEALIVLEEFSPDIFFVDIKMPNQNGFELLKKIQGLNNIYFVFVTAHDEYVLPALRAGVFDYLLKPVEPVELKRVITKVYQSKLKKSTSSQSIGKDKKISIRNTRGFSLISLNEITHLEANNNYTNIFLLNNKKLCISKTLKEFHEKLGNELFVRVHKSYVINLLYLKGCYHKMGGNYARIGDKTSVPVTKYTMHQLEQLIN